jgi:hypothetical protein
MVAANSSWDFIQLMMLIYYRHQYDHEFSELLAAIVAFHAHHLLLTRQNRYYK